MSCLRPILIACVTLTLLGGCVAGTSPGGAAATGTAADGGVAAEPIEVTSLDAPPTAGASPAAVPGDAPAAVAAPSTDAALALDGATDKTLAEPPPPEVVKSPSQIACEKKRGRFVKVGDTSAFACVHDTRDAGKRCSKAGDCQGLCLARSRTCSPYTPVFGCQDILQQDGIRVKQCVE